MQFSQRLDACLVVIWGPRFLELSSERRRFTECSSLAPRVKKRCGIAFCRGKFYLRAPGFTYSCCWKLQCFENKLPRPVTYSQRFQFVAKWGVTAPPNTKAPHWLPFPWFSFATLEKTAFPEGLWLPLIQKKWLQYKYKG